MTPEKKYEIKNNKMIPNLSKSRQQLNSIRQFIVILFAPLIFVSFTLTTELVTTPQALVAAPNDRITTTNLFCHWGSQQGNEKILSLAGSKSQGSGAFNDAVARSFLSNYLGMPAKDLGAMNASGPGLYLSTNFYDSKQYGNYLLMVEVVDQLGNPASLPVVKGDGALPQKTTVKKMLENQNYGDLPLAHFYTQTWLVIHRPPKASEGVFLRVRSPLPRDAHYIWQQSYSKNQSKNKAFLQEVTGLGRTVNGDADKATQQFAEELAYKIPMELIRKQTPGSRDLLLINSIGSMIETYIDMPETPAYFWELVRQGSPQEVAEIFKAFEIDGKVADILWMTHDQTADREILVSKLEEATKNGKLWRNLSAVRDGVKEFVQRSGSLKPVKNCAGLIREFKLSNKY